MDKFHYAEKVMITHGIHADRIGEIRGESANPFFRQWLVFVDYYAYGKWDIDWIPERYLYSLEEIEEEDDPHPECLKW